MLLAAVGYGGAAAGFQWNLLRQQKQEWSRWTRWVWVSFALHSLALICLWIRVGNPPFFHLKELIASVSWLVIGLYAMLGRRSKMEALGTIAAPMACVCTAFSAFTLANDRDTLDPSGRSWWLSVHIGSLMGSYAFFCMAAFCALLYFLQASYLKRKRLRGALLLPSLDALDRASFRFILAGFPLMILGIVSGTLISNYQLSWDFKQALVGVTCVFYLIYLHARGIAGWRGKRVNGILLIAFALLLLAVLAPSRFHQH
jgi:ABC-type transport system involved in cytochrome c biogenesis permease subunit